MLTTRRAPETVFTCHDGNCPVETEAESSWAAAQEYVDGGDWGDDHPSWIHVYVTADDVDAEREEHVIVIEPEEPSCVLDEHEWEDCGVKINGGGVITYEHCPHCGVRRITDTWAMDPETGRQGYTVVTFEEEAINGTD